MEAPKAFSPPTLLRKGEEILHSMGYAFELGFSGPPPLPPPADKSSTPKLGAIQEGSRVFWFLGPVL